MRGLALALLLAPAAAWRDQHIRVSPQLQSKLAEESRRRLSEGKAFHPAEKDAAKRMMALAEKVHARNQAGLETKEYTREHVGHIRRNLLNVATEAADGKQSMTTDNSAAETIVINTNLFDCPWVSRLHGYAPAPGSPPPPPGTFLVDGGLCLPYQEIAFPFQFGPGTPAFTSAPVNFTTAGIVCPSPNWNADWAMCFATPCTSASGPCADPVPCVYPGDATVHGGATGIGENYGCAAAHFGWPSSSVAETQTPICKTHVKDCKYSKPSTRSYQWGPGAGIMNPGQGFSIDWVLSEVGKLRNQVFGSNAAVAQDLGLPGWSFPETVYTDLFGKPAGTLPPTSGKYPHAYTKGLFTSGATPVIDESRDGECGVTDAAPQWMDCGIPCPVGDEARMAPSEMTSFQVAVLVFAFGCAVLGAITFLLVGKDTQKFFVGGRDLNVFVVMATLASQSLDSNAALGNLDLGFAYHWWDGACLPIGLGLSLFLNGLFFAKPLNEMKLLTLPDVFAYTFGPACEVLFSLLAILSFTCLLAGNLVGAGKIVTYLFGFANEVAGVWLMGFAIWLYTVAGGLLSVAYTDCVQAVIGWTGLVGGAVFVLNYMPAAAGSSPAYPYGDVPVSGAQMSDADALDPIPNAIQFNWITIFVLGFGNLAALDFQARVMSAKTPKTAVIGCIGGAIISWIVGVTFSYTTGSIRALYGPSSPHAEFVADSCSKDITVIGCFGANCDATIVPGVPTCGEWKPNPMAPLMFWTCTKPNCHYFADFDGSGGQSTDGAFSEAYYPMSAGIGAWVLVSIVAASMSTGDGAILAMSTVSAHNLARKLPFPFFKEEKNLLLIARLMTLIWFPLAAIIAGAVPGETGYLLIVAFDIMLAGSVVPLFAAVYWKSCKPFAAFVSMLGGSVLRLILEYALPKDGLLLLVGKFAKSFGPGSYAGINPATGAPWATTGEYMADGSTTPVDWCPQSKLADWTGIDSLAAPLFSLVLLLVFQLLPSPAIPAFTAVERPKEDTTKTAEAVEVANA